MKYNEIAQMEFIKKITVLTGIKEEVLLQVVKENGITFILEHPKAVPCTAAQKKKLIALNEFISSYREALFLKETIEINSSQKAKDYFLSRLCNKYDFERFEVAFLNTQNEIIATQTLSEGVINEAVVYPRKLVEAVINHDASRVILAHNHPGGSLKPSSADIELTKKLYEALKTISVAIIDHIIVANNETYSFAEQGLLPN